MPTHVRGGFAGRKRTFSTSYPKGRKVGEDSPNDPLDGTSANVRFIGVYSPHSWRLYRTPKKLTGRYIALSRAKGGVPPGVEISEQLVGPDVLDGVVWWMGAGGGGSEK